MNDDITAILRTRGHRVTRPRRAVWRTLIEADGHLTVEEIADRVRHREPGVNLASVYRSLALFEELDLARASRIGGDDAGQWELAHPDEHVHLHCEVCGDVSHHVGEHVGSLREHLLAEHAFDARNVELVVTGRCDRCR